MSLLDLHLQVAPRSVLGLFDPLGLEGVLVSQVGESVVICVSFSYLEW